MKYIGVVLAALGSVAAHPHHGPPPPPPMTAAEKNAFAEVEKSCQHDLETVCKPPEPVVEDPVIQWLMAPPQRMAAPPMLHREALAPFDPLNIGSLLDHMMDSALSMERMVQSSEPAFFLVYDLTQVGPQEPQTAPAALDSMVSKLVKHSEDTHDVSHHIRLKGKEVLMQDNIPEERRRLARRLTEVTPEEAMKMQMRYHREHPHGHEDHHMCPKKHKCLMQAMQKNMVQPACARSLTQLQQIHRTEADRMAKTDLYMAMFQIYCLLFILLFSMIVARKVKGGKGTFWLRLKVLQAVYSNPAIKAKVEGEVGAPLGDVPPLPLGALKMLSANGRHELREKRQRFLNLTAAMLMLVAMDAFGLLPSWWPLFMMGSCCGFLVYKMITMCCSQPEEPECKCCCCGGSTLDVQNGTISDAQACCKCCKGTGICAPKCRTCCGTSDDDMADGGCCGGSCGCSDDHGCNGDCGCCGDAKTCDLNIPRVDLDDSCCCCCCGASILDAKQGNISDAQACCSCCKGSGCCSKECASCCGGAGRSRTRTFVGGPKLVVYEGVPVEIV